MNAADYALLVSLALLLGFFGGYVLAALDDTRDHPDRRRR